MAAENTIRPPPQIRSSFALQTVRIAQFREDFFYALSAPLRAPRKKGNLFAAGRAAILAFFCGRFIFTCGIASSIPRAILQCD
ncbi:MAG: hypothetical protein ABSG04_13435, partial [Verrucomicrobiota bacterium]